MFLTKTSLKINGADGQPGQPFRMFQITLISYKDTHSLVTPKDVINMLRVCCKLVVKQTRNRLSYSV
jgi:hypothetical protein